MVGVNIQYQWVSMVKVEKQNIHINTCTYYTFESVVKMQCNQTVKVILILIWPDSWYKKRVYRPSCRTPDSLPHFVKFRL